MRALVPLLVLVSAVAAGCTSPPAGGGGPGDQPGVITDPRDLSYLQNSSLPAGSHIHDYWGGRDRVQVLDGSGFDGGASCQGCTDGMEFDSTRPDEGRIVPQGTAWVNGTFTLRTAGENTFTRLELWVKTAQDSEERRWGPIQSGVPFSIDTTQEANDPPHYVLSLWRFSVRAYRDGSDEIAVRGSSHWSVEAVRGLPLVPYPPHADRWNGAAQLDLLTAKGTTQLTYHYEVAGGGSTTCYSGCPGLHILPDGAVVPFDTDHVEVRLRVDSGVPTGLGLWFHGADTWDMSKADGEMAAPGEMVYSIPIEGPMADSPYAPQSLWEFRVWLDQPAPAQAWSGGYTLTVKAFQDPAPA